MNQLLELKNWNEYTIYEQKELLNHWWFYYGKMLYTAEELKRFNEMVDQNPYQILSIAIISYINGYSSQPLLQAIRDNNIEDLIATLPSLNNKDQDFINSYKETESHFISILVKSYNNPEPDVPMKLKDVIKQGLEIARRRKL